MHRSVQFLQPRKGLEEAKALFQKAIKTSPNYGLSYRYLGDTYEQTRDLLKALENWKIFAHKDLKGGAIVYGKIESALFDLGQYSEDVKKHISDFNVLLFFK